MSVIGLVVHSRGDLDDDETERMIDALMMFRLVTKVTPVEVRGER